MHRLNALVMWCVLRWWLCHVVAMGTGPHLQEGDPLGGDPGPDHMGRGSPILDL